MYILLFYKNEFYDDNMYTDAHMNYTWPACINVLYLRKEKKSIIIM